MRSLPQDSPPKETNRAQARKQQLHLDGRMKTAMKTLSGRAGTVLRLEKEGGEKMALRAASIVKRVYTTSKYVNACIQ